MSHSLFAAVHLLQCAHWRCHGGVRHELLELRIERRNNTACETTTPIAGHGLCKSRGSRDDLQGWKRARGHILRGVHTAALEIAALLTEGEAAVTAVLPDPLLSPSTCTFRFCPRLRHAMSAIY